VSQEENRAEATVVASADDLKRALRPRRENVVPVQEPLVLICQAQRSGGTLLARLFDAHSECHAHPHELMIGYPKPHTWPELPLDEDPDIWFGKLRERYLSTLFTKGQRRVPLKASGDKVRGAYPFIMPPGFQRMLFLDEVRRRSPLGSERDVLDCYMTSLFNAWLDNQNLRGTEKRWVVAFSPRRAWGDGLTRFFSIYPDGRLISILRDPLSWFTSAKGRAPAAEQDKLLDVWKRSAREMLEARRRFGDAVAVVRFDELVLDTAGVMRRLANWLGIEFDERLLSPTFNGYPVGPNSSFETSETGVVSAPVERYRELLTDEQQERIRSECDVLYEEALALSETQAGS
jgi:Sulfotransferase family